MRAEGRPEGEVGHYVVEVTFPEAGDWAWSITAAPNGALDLSAPTLLHPIRLGVGDRALAVEALILGHLRPLHLVPPVGRR